MSTISLASRVAAIRLQQKDLALLAKVDKHTVNRMLADETAGYVVKRRAVSDALEAEERALLIHLIQLHPEAARAHVDALAAPTREAAE